MVYSLLRRAYERTFSPSRKTRVDAQTRILVHHIKLDEN